MKMLRTFQAVVFILVSTVTCLQAQEMPIYEWSHDYRRDSGHGLFSDYQSTTDANGNVYLSGVMNADLDADPGPGVFTLTEVNNSYDDVFIIKLNAAGVFQWAHSYTRGGAQNGPGDIVVDAAGNVFFASYYQIAFATNDTRLVKFDAAGNELWVKIIATRAWGGRELALDASGNVLMAGGFAGTVDFDPNAGVESRTASTTGTDSDMFLLKLNTNGDLMWVKTTGGPGNKQARSMFREASGNILITGEYSGGVSDFDFGAATANLTPVGVGDIFVLKVEDDGDFIWVRSMGGSDVDVPFAIAANANGNIFVTGYFRGSGDFDPTAGVTTLSTTLGNDMFLVRLNADGSFGWASQFGTTGNPPDEGKSIAIDAAGNLLVTGTFMGTVDFDPGAGVTNLTSVGTFLRGNAFIFKMTEDRTLVWARAFGSTSNVASSTGTSVKVENSGMITVVGYTNGNLQANFGPCTNGEGGSTTHGFIVKLSLGFEAQPTITSVSPSAGAIGTEVVITGTNFGTDPADLEVRFGSNRLATITSLTTTTITTTVPAASTTGQIYLKLKCFAGILSPQSFTVGTPPTPTITSFTPASGIVGATVTITGTNFSTTPANNTVAFNGTTAVVTASTATSITTTVPAGATTGKITVVVNGITATSANNFTVTAPPAGATITVNTQPSNKASCAGEAVVFAVNASGTANIKYQWQFSTDGIAAYTDISNGGAYSNATTSNLTVAAATGNAGFYRARINGDLAPEVFSNAAQLTIITTGCNPIVVVPGELKVYNAVSPNGDGKNDILFLESIDLLPDTKTNRVHIFNRWGDEVFTTNDYDNKTRVFSGTGKDGNKLPTGVYYYKIELPDKNQTLTGYIQLKL